jgi:multidrug efflux pump subunit AcrA (membrane-fusion protein)
MHVATVGAHDQVVMKPVTIGRDYGSDIEVIQGLTAEDKVILSPPDSLTDGVNVHVAPPAPGKVAKS